MSRQDLAIEQKVLRGLKTLSKPPRRILLALSGGVDSMVMAAILFKWRKGLGVELGVAHIHHGPSQNKTQTLYRQKARRFVKAWTKKNNLAFYTNAQPLTLSPSRPLSRPLTSESDLREFREKHLATFCREGNFSAVAFAHHQDDLLETRLIRLIRGSGTQGMRSMSMYRQSKFRPLLHLSSAEIFEYAEIKKLKWVEDPSNVKTDALRNWLRQLWLPSLEEKRPGALKALARSLEMLSPVTQSSEFDLAPFVGLRRESFVGKSESELGAVLAQYLKALGLKGYARTHVRELIKRLDGVYEKQSVQFEMLGLVFKISPDFLWASRV